MPTKLKIKIQDDAGLRVEIDRLYESSDPILLARWSLSVARHIFAMAGINYRAIDEVTDGFRVNEQWQAGQARIHDVRQAGFRVHQRARSCEDEIEKTALRVAGQAIASGHMKEHAMVASDYAVKIIELLYHRSSGATGRDVSAKDASAKDASAKDASAGEALMRAAITAERQWQLDELKKLK